MVARETSLFNRFRRHAGNSRGASLIEVLIVLIVFGVGISAALRTLPSSSKASNTGRNISRSTSLAMEKVEELLAVPYNDIDLTDGTHSDAGNPIELHFTRRWTVTENYPVTGMKRIVVTVRFPTDRADSTVTLTTFR